MVMSLALWENIYKMEQIMILWAFMHREKQHFLKFLPVPVPYFQSQTENLFYFHAALYTDKKNCRGIIQIYSCSEWKLQETPEVNSSRIIYVSPY